MELLPADYVLGGLVCILAVLGLFRGVSGMLAFVLASSAAAVVGSFCWPYSETLTGELWQRGAGTLLAVLLTFGLVRIVVRKCVNGLLAQPTDALLGLVIGAVSGMLVIVVWAKVGLFHEHSTIVQRVAPYVNAVIPGSVGVGTAADGADVDG